MKTHRQLLVMMASAFAAGFGFACSSSSSNTGSGGGTDAGHDSAMDAGSDVGSAMDAPADTYELSDAGCVIISNGASVVMQQNLAAGEPAATGTTIPDGTYFVTADSNYVGEGGTAGPSGQTVQFTSRVSGLTLEAIESINGGAAIVFGGTLAPSGSNVTIIQTCPATDAGPSPYDLFSSDGTNITFYTSTLPFTSLTFTRQP